MLFVFEFLMLHLFIFYWFLFFPFFCREPELLKEEKDADEQSEKGSSDSVGIEENEEEGGYFEHQDNHDKGNTVT